MARRSAGINFPNVLTLIRIALVPPIIFLILVPWGGNFEGAQKIQTIFNIITAALFLIAALTDLFDGAIARSTNQVTDFGKFLDPVADKMLILGTLVALAGSERFSYLRLAVVISACIILLRELAVTSIRMVANSHDGTVISANIFGKIKTVVSVVTVIVILVEGVIFGNGGLAGIYLLSYIMLGLTVMLTVFSGFTYLKKYFSYIDPRK
ncbi:MAG: CDP-diacylglycerol--glycerol-3-phosphate 3-phosphatidyltransferase [Clostridia bacterium]|nr:CDP-diacylglycerol--glycerol-3-phosphate 3-phosphatidyltransferase [Clostridia bacterium]